MASRREFLQKGLGLSAAGMLGVPMIGCASHTVNVATARPVHAPARVAASGEGAAAAASAAAPSKIAPATELEPPPDIFDAQALDLEFWLKPRVIDVIRPASGERAKILYWKDGEVIDSAYQELCHIMRDVNGKAAMPIDPKLFETLWGTQAF